MSIMVEERLSDSPYVERVMRGRTVSDGALIRPAESHWHMVFVRYHGNIRPLVVGPWTSSGLTSYGEDAELLWIKFKLGAFMPHLPLRDCLDFEMMLPGAASHSSFWLKSAAWQVPDYDNVETFVERLVREEVLVRDPVVDAVLQGHALETPPRTVRHRFLHATGMSHSQIQQIARAQQAATLLQQGKSILDTVFEAGYTDQPHLTRSLKHWVGHTPAQILRSQSAA